MGTVASSFKHRARVMRPGAASGPWNTPGDAAEEHAALPCAVWQPSSAELRGTDAAGGNRGVQQGAYWMLCALGMVQQGDTLATVVDRRGTTLFTNLRVQSVARRPDGYAQVELEDAP